jgi:hypothetical protein
MHPTKNRLSWMELGAAPPRSAYIRVGSVGGPASEIRFTPLASWSAGWLLVSGPPSIPPESPCSRPPPRKTQVTRERLQDFSWTPPATGLVVWDDLPGRSWLLSWRGQRKSWTALGRSRGYPLETSRKCRENVMIRGSIPWKMLINNSTKPWCLGF